jgi:hypothetical protein
LLPTSVRRLSYFVVGLAALSLTELGRGYYRPFIRAHALNDLHVADTLGNSFGTITTVFMCLAVFGRGDASDRRFLFIGPVSVFVFELAQPLLGKRADPWDLLATILAGGLSAMLYRVLWRAADLTEDSRSSNVPSDILGR